MESILVAKETNIETTKSIIINKHDKSTGTRKTAQPLSEPDADEPLTIGAVEDTVIKGIFYEGMHQQRREPGFGERFVFPHGDLIVKFIGKTHFFKT